jgi:putative ABC transport system permease protein
MQDAGAPRGWKLVRVLYRALLMLYPRGFRRRFGDRMLEDFRRMYEARVRAEGWLGGARACGRITLDTVSAGLREHAETLRRARSAPRAWAREEKGDRMGRLVSDAHSAFRAITRRPGYSVVAVATLAFAIGANTALFSVLHGVLLRPLPYPEAHRLVLLSESPASFNNVSYPNFRDWRDGTRSFEEMGAFGWTTVTVTGGSDPMRVSAGRAEPAFMHASGLEPVLGRAFREPENAPGAPPVVILSHALWTQSFGADPDILGEAVLLNGSPFEVVGVLGEGADFAESGAALWVPLVPAIGDWVDRRGVHALSVLARLADGVSRETARLELEGVGESLSRAYPDSNAGRGATLVSLDDALLGEVTATVWLLMGMVALVLLIACANLANLLLVRLASRREELAMRRALGASRWDVTRLFLVESMALTLTGGVAGVGLANLAIGASGHLLRGHLPRIEEVSLDTTVLGFAVAVSIATGLLFGLLPAITREGRRLGGRGSAGSEHSTIRLRSTLSAAQVAGAVVLLVGSGLLIRSFQNLQSVDVGFDPENLATMAVSLSGSGRTSDEVIQFYRDVSATLEMLPGVASAAAVNALPISGGDSNGSVTVDGRPFAPGEAPTASFRRISPGYFETVGTPMLHGRAFEDTDVGEQMVTIVNESMARLLWDDPADAIGARIKVGPPDFEPWLTVVGVAGDIRNVGLEIEPRLATYEPHAQRPWTTMSLVFRTEGEPAAVTDAVRRLVRQAGGEIPVYDFSTLGERISESLRPRRIALLLAGAFAFLTLLTASIGVYGVLAYSVQQRTPEFGVRLALGAGRGRLIKSVAAQAARVILAGLGTGLVGAALLSRVLESALFGVSRYDALTFAVVPLLLGLVGTLACLAPARRAAQIDPASSLRGE